MSERRSALPALHSPGCVTRSSQAIFRLQEGPEPACTKPSTLALIGHGEPVMGAEQSDSCGHDHWSLRGVLRQQNVQKPSAPMQAPASRVKNRESRAVFGGYVDRLWPDSKARLSLTSLCV
jgi:hypothetical protein